MVGQVSLIRNVSVSKKTIHEKLLIIATRMLGWWCMLLLTCCIMVMVFFFKKLDTPVCIFFVFMCFFLFLMGYLSIRVDVKKAGRLFKTLRERKWKLFDLGKKYSISDVCHIFEGESINTDKAKFDYLGLYIYFFCVKIFGFLLFSLGFFLFYLVIYMLFREGVGSYQDLVMSAILVFVAFGVCSMGHNFARAKTKEVTKLCINLF